MKLHSIEAMNLNSLYDRNAIDLDQRLEGASLFLIYGPTGSGKSTLMDAVSLALFGVTPRLDAEHGNDAADPSAIMSRGTGECSATIVFSKLEGGGRQTYRARWTCWRAHNDPEGAPQRPERSLDRLKSSGDWRQDDDWELVVSSRKNKDYEPPFEKVLEGFGVKDFNRSMLLAQGQFDAFLAAPADERAEILERLTDTEVYQRIGERAARMHGRHSQKLKGLGTLAAAAGGLDPQELAVLEKQHEENTTQLAQQNKAHEQAAANLTWFNEDITRRKDLTTAKDDQKELLDDAKKSKDALAQLAEHERCEKKKAFVLLTNFGAAQKRVEELEEQLTALDVALPDLELTAKKAQEAAKAAAQRAHSAAEQLEVLRPLATAAENSASNHKTACKLASQTAASLQDTDKQVDTADKALGKATDLVAEVRQKCADAKAELEAHAADGKLADTWDALRTRLDQLVSTSENLQKNATSLAERRKGLKQDRDNLEEVRRTHEATRGAALNPAQDADKSAKDSLLERLAGSEFDEARKQAAGAVERARAHGKLVQDAQTPVATARKDATALQGTRVQIDSLSNDLTTTQKELEGFAREVEKEQKLEEQTDKALKHLELVADLVRHRVDLKDGDECPLCGSEEHPWVGDPDRIAKDAKVKEVVDEARAAHEKARAAHEKAKSALDKGKGTTRDLTTKLELLKTQAKDATQKQTKLDIAATEALKAIDLPTDSSVDEVEEALQHAARGVKNAESALSELDHACGLVNQAAKELRKAHDAQKEADEALRDDKAKLKERGKQLDRDDAKHGGAQKQSIEQQAACRVELETHGLTLDDEEPASWRKLGDQRRDDHKARVKAIADLMGQVETAVEMHNGSKELLAERETQQKTLVKKLTTEQADRDRRGELSEQARQTLDKAWRKTLEADDARPVDERPPADATPLTLVEAQLAWVKHTNKSKEAASADESRDVQFLTGNRIERKTLASEEEKSQTARSRARTALDTALKSLELTKDGALRALRINDDRLSDLRERRDELKRRKIDVEARIDAQSKLVNAHTQERPATLREAPTPDALAEDASNTEQQLRDATQAHQDTGDRLRDHVQAEKKREENRKKLREAEKEARLWKTLHGCIGKNDGGSFKQFAQALNLGQLLDKANVHLARLTKRYRLIPRLHEGLPTLDFDLSDLWQVGERVAPRSLSGGERFLVSLSLALGLSDFRAVKMTIETLLLDEGFGTLDPATLSDALGALSQLQADGRQVGIISHVEGLKERVEARIEVKPLGGGRSKVQPPG